MPDLKYWQDKIIERRKNTDFRDFLKEIVSWYPFVFYKRDGLITNLPVSNRINKKIVSSLEFEELKDKLLSKGIKYNFDIDFFSNYQILFKSIPMYNLFSLLSENADYADNVYNSKNVYLSNGVIHDCENVFYSFYIKLSCTNVFNSFMVWDSCDNIYNSAGIIKSYKVFYSKYIYESNNIWFSTNLNGCSDCIMCDSLENVKYHISNKKYTRDEYIIKRDEILNNKSEYYKYYSNLKKRGKGAFSKNCSGNFTPMCENIENGYFSYNVHDGKNIMLMGSKEGNTSFYDCFAGGSPKGDRYYGCCYVGTYAEDLFSCHTIDYGKNLMYCYSLTNCSYCLGCIGLKNQSYCILNKQYTKSEREELSEKILEQMDNDGILGDFFPGKLNPYNFNDTMAGILGNFSKQEVEKQGYMWREQEIKIDIPEDAEIISINKLSDYEGFNGKGNWNIDSSILEKVIKDDKGQYYRIIKLEYDFLKKYNLPLPENHWMDRIKLNFGI